MADILQLQYATMLSNRLERFKIKSTNPYKINFRCPICGDSKTSKTKARGWLLENRSSNNFRFYCHNCTASLTFNNFLKTVDQLVYNEYIAAKYVSDATGKAKEPPKQEKYDPPKFNKNDPLRRIKKVSSLKPNHPVRQYIKERRIPPKQHYRLFYAPKFKTWINTVIPNKFEYFKKDEPRLILPFKDEKGVCFGVAARGFDPDGLRYISIMFEERPKIFGLDKVDMSKRYFIVEGAIDSLFLDNAIAMAGADGNMHGLDMKNAVYVFDNEPRNKQIHKAMDKVISNGNKVCIWPSYIEQKDINDMILAGIEDIESIIDRNTYSGLEAKLRLTSWRKV